MICKYFSHSITFFTFLSVLWYTRVLYFNEVQFIYFFSFVACVFGVLSKNPLPNPRSWEYLNFSFLLESYRFLMNIDLLVDSFLSLSTLHILSYCLLSSTALGEKSATNPTGGPLCMSHLYIFAFKILPLSFNSLIMMCPGMNFFEFIIPEVCKLLRRLMIFIKFSWFFGAIISSDTLSVLFSPFPLLLELPLCVCW